MTDTAKEFQWEAKMAAKRASLTAVLKVDKKEMK